MSEAKGTVIPNFLSARSPKALRRLMLMTNKRLGAWHNYQIIFNVLDSKWYAWYHEEITRSNINELIDDPIANDTVVIE